MRSLFIQKELGERRGNWVTALQEYDLKFKPASIVKGQGLCRLMTENRNNEEHVWEDEAELHLMDVCPLFTALESWYRDLVHYLQTGSLPEIGILSKEEYCILNQHHIKLLKEYYSEKITTDFFLDA